MRLKTIPWIGLLCLCMASVPVGKYSKSTTVIAQTKENANQQGAKKEAQEEKKANRKTVIVVTEFVSADTAAKTVTFETSQGEKLTWPVAAEQAGNLEGLKPGDRLAVRFTLDKSKKSPQALFSKALPDEGCQCRPGCIQTPCPATCPGSCTGKCPTGYRCDLAALGNGFACACVK